MTKRLNLYKVTFETKDGCRYDKYIHFKTKLQTDSLFNEAAIMSSLKCYDKLISYELMLDNIEIIYY